MQYNVRAELLDLPYRLGRYLAEDMNKNHNIPVYSVTIEFNEATDKCTISAITFNETDCKKVAKYLYSKYMLKNRCEYKIYPNRYLHLVRMNKVSIEKFYMMCALCRLEQGGWNG